MPPLHAVLEHQRLPVRRENRTVNKGSYQSLSPHQELFINLSYGPRSPPHSSTLFPLDFRISNDASSGSVAMGIGGWGILIHLSASAD